MQLSLMDVTAWTFALVGLIGFFKYGDDPWGKVCFAGMLVVAIIQMLVLREILQIDFLQESVVLPSILLFTSFICLGGVEEKTYSSVVVYAGLLQFLLYFDVIS